MRACTKKYFTQVCQIAAANQSRRNPLTLWSPIPPRGSKYTGQPLMFSFDASEHKYFTRDQISEWTRCRLSAGLYVTLIALNSVKAAAFFTGLTAWISADFSGLWLVVLRTAMTFPTIFCHTLHHPLRHSIATARWTLEGRQRAMMLPCLHSKWSLQKKKIKSDCRAFNIAEAQVKMVFNVKMSQKSVILDQSFWSSFYPSLGQNFQT